MKTTVRKRHNKSKGRIFGMFHIYLTEEQSEIVRQAWHRHGGFQHMMVGQPKGELNGWTSIDFAVINPSAGAALNKVLSKCARPDTTKP